MNEYSPKLLLKNQPAQARQPAAAAVGQRVEPQLDELPSQIAKLL